MLDYTQREALLAVKRKGSFARAAEVLRITPIGVSRRIAKLKLTLGVKLLNRKPTRPTEAGEAACFYAEPIEALEIQLLEEQRIDGLQPPTPYSTFKIAINHGSFFGWFCQILKDRSKRECAQRLDISLVDQASTIELMGSREVVATLSPPSKPANSCPMAAQVRWWCFDHHRAIFGQCEQRMYWCQF